jgi:hypothetical protein
MDKGRLMERSIYDYKSYTFDDLLKRYDIGINRERMVSSFEELLPTINKYGWWAVGKQGHQAQFAIQSRPGSNDPYHESCGPQPNLNKEDSSNSLTEGSFSEINEMFKGTYFEDIINMFPFPIYRTRILRVSSKACYRLHRDMTYKFHIPLVTSPSNMFIWPEQEHRYIVHLPANGSVYYTDTAIPHTFMNGGTDYRYHLVISGMITREEIFEKLKSYKKDFDREHFPTLDENGEWK